MKILQVNCVYKKGSTGKIAFDIHTELLRNEYESVICYGRGDKISEVGVYKTCGELYSKFNNLLSRVTGIMYGGCFFSTNRLISIIKKENPDIVHLHCINGYFVNIFKIISWLKTHKIKTVLTLHAEFMHTANCSHAFECEKWKTGCGKCPVYRKETKSLFIDNTALSWRKMKNAFDNFDELIVTSVSPWLMERAKQSPILSDKKHVAVLNGINTDIFQKRDSSKLKKELGLENKKIIFHATAFFSDNANHPKGGHTIIQLANEFPDIVFIVAGPYEVSKSIPENVVLLGRVTDQEKLAEYYNIADVSIITGRRETFSMIVAESLCCGTPIIGYKAGGPESIALSEYCHFVEYGDFQALKKELETYIESNKPNLDIKKIKEAYSKERMTQNYIDVYTQQMNS